MVSAVRDHCMFKKYTDLVSKTIFDSKLIRLTQMLKRVVGNGNATGH